MELYLFACVSVSSSTFLVIERKQAVGAIAYRLAVELDGMSFLLRYEENRMIFFVFVISFHTAAMHK